MMQCLGIAFSVLEREIREERRLVQVESVGLGSPKHSHRILVEDMPDHP
jgi:hypothetical protein